MSELLPALDLRPPGEVRGAVLWLHGLGADGHDFEPLLPRLPLGELGVRVVLPHAPSQPVSINGGLRMPAWYDIRDGDLRRRHDEAGIRASQGALEAWLERLARDGVAPERTALVGFSQGGAMALHLGLRRPQALAGVAVLSAYLLLEERLAAEASEAGRAAPIFQAHGRFDQVVDPARGQAARTWLEGAGCRHTWREYPMGHEVCPAELEDLGAWFREVFA